MLAALGSKDAGRKDKDAPDNEAPQEQEDVGASFAAAIVEENPDALSPREDPEGHFVNDLPHPPPHRDWSGNSLHGRSLVVPSSEDFDDMSSIHTNQFSYYNNEMRIVGAAQHDRDAANARNYEGPVRDATPRSGRKSKATYEYHSARPKDDKTLGTEESHEEGCLPFWITEAPGWLKVAICFSFALLLGAIVMVGVGAALVVQKKGGQSKSIQGSPSGPISTEMPTAAPRDMELDDAPLAPAPSENPVEPEISTTEPPSASVPDKPDSTPSPTASPTAGVLIGEPFASSVTFYLMGGRVTGDALTRLPDQLQTLPNEDGNTVLFHLGDWNSPFVTQCSEESYVTNVELFSNSAVPVYFVPGDNEYNDCPNPNQAFDFWREYLLDFETQFWDAPTDWTISRQHPDYSENFAFVHNRVLFVGINLVGGLVHDVREWLNRFDANLDWLDKQFVENRDEVEVMVVLAHSDPTLQANANFFRSFYERVENDYDVQVILAHRNLGVEPWALQSQLNGIQNLMAVVVEGSVWPPMRLRIDTKAGTIEVNQGDWHDNYMAGKTP